MPESCPGIAAHLSIPIFRFWNDGDRLWTGNCPNMMYIGCPQVREPNTQCQKGNGHVGRHSLAAARCPRKYSEETNRRYQHLFCSGRRSQRRMMPPSSTLFFVSFLPIHIVPWAFDPSTITGECVQAQWHTTFIVCVTRRTPRNSQSR